MPEVNREISTTKCVRVITHIPNCLANVNCQQTQRIYRVIIPLCTIGGYTINVFKLQSSDDVHTTQLAKCVRAFDINSNKHYVSQLLLLE